MLVCFTGMDGTGKTTVARRLQQKFSRLGQRTWYFNSLNGDSLLRQFLKPITAKVRKRTHRNGAYIMKSAGLLRFWPYFSLLDSYATYPFLKLRSWRGMVIIDRYFYDEIAIMVSTGLISAKRGLKLIKMMPVPDVVFHLQTSANTAYARKPEHPLEFFQRQEKFYTHLPGAVNRLISLDTESANADIVWKIVAQHLGLENDAPNSSLPKPWVQR